jgi:hypothetical protein
MWKEFSEQNWTKQKKIDGIMVKWEVVNLMWGGCTIVDQLGFVAKC